QFLHSSLSSHLKLALRVLKYLKGDPGKGIHLTRGSKTELVTYVDSNWANCKATRSIAWVDVVQNRRWLVLGIMARAGLEQVNYAKGQKTRVVALYFNNDALIQ
ncbi:hypothetical protein Tco_0405663, partial [Tanacetum coccineum]